MGVVSFVVLHYGEHQVTKNCIDSILEQQTKQTIQIVIIDNDYQKAEEERKKLEQQYEHNGEVHIIRTYKQTGFSEANNIGYHYTKREHNPQYVVVTNNDIVFEQKDFVNRLKDIDDKYHFEILSPDIISQRNGAHQSPIAASGRSVKQVNRTIWLNVICLKQFMVAYPFLKKKYGQDVKQKQEAHVNITQENIVPCGACIILSKSFLKKEDLLFSPETQFYYEEYILHHRCIEKGYRIIYTPELHVLHGDGIATKKQAGNKKNRLKFMLENTVQSARIYRDLIQKKSK